VFILRARCVCQPHGPVSVLQVLSRCAPAQRGQGGLPPQCEAGKAANQPGSQSCAECGSTQVASQQGSASCDECPTNAKASTGNSVCECLPSFYLVVGDSATECLSCPPEVDCDQGGATAGALVAKPGKWSGAGLAADEFYSCPFPGACLGTANSTCARGHTGVLCAVCIDDFYLKSQSCVPCGKGSTVAVWIVLAVFALVLVLAAVGLAVLIRLGKADGAALANRMPDMSKSSVAAKVAIVIAFLQVASVSDDVYEVCLFVCLLLSLHVLFFTIIIIFILLLTLLLLLLSFILCLSLLVIHDRSHGRRFTVTGSSTSRCSSAPS
jgi:hypothetical protein